MAVAEVARLQEPGRKRPNSCESGYKKPFTALPFGAAIRLAARRDTKWLGNCMGRMEESV
jgi:hypothetical protein